MQAGNRVAQRAARSIPLEQSGSRPVGKNVVIPGDRDHVVVERGDRSLVLSDLRRPLCSHPRLIKADLLRHYVRLAPVLLAHLRGRAVVLKGLSQPPGAVTIGPPAQPRWIELGRIEDAAGETVHYLMVRDVLALLWAVDLGYTTLPHWAAPHDDLDRPDRVLFTLDGGPGTSFAQVREAATIVHGAATALRMPVYVAVGSAHCIHLQIPIRRGPTQRQVWDFARELARSLAALHDDLLTTETRRGRRPRQRVVLDYGGNAWGRTVPAVYSAAMRPHPRVVTPVTWTEIGHARLSECFDLNAAAERLHRFGDLWAPLAAAEGRFPLESLL